jgi:nucleoside-diphosphate-sugar epimerase
MNKIILEDIKEIVSQDITFEKFANKNILITGANGFLPAYLVETLLFLNSIKKLNLKVYGLVRSLDKAKIRFSEYLNDFALQFIHQDVSEPLKLNDPIHYIIHAASQASPKYYKTDPVGTLKANVMGTLQLLEFARIQKLESFLFFSSGEVYGQVPNELIPIKETSYGYIDLQDVSSCYAESKRLCENACVAYLSQFQVPAKIVRPFHTYGPGMALDDGRVFSDFVNNILKNENIIMKSDGSARRAYCYLADATLAFLTILLKGKNGQAYNVGNPNAEVSVLELAEELISIFADKKLQVEKIHRAANDNYMPSPITRNSPDISKISALGWTPKYTIKSGFKRTVESFNVT